MILVPEVDRPSQGWTGEAAMCLSAGAKKQSGEESGTAADAFECARARDRGEKRGSGGGHRVEGGNGEKEGARAAGIGARPMGAGGGVAARQWRAVGRARRGRDWLMGGTGDSGARWAAAGCGRARQRGATLTRRPDSTVLGGVNSNWIQKNIANGFKFAQI
jgi:hypothetical protein